jgi:hypothetical protein
MGDPSLQLGANLESPVDTKFHKTDYVGEISESAQNNHQCMWRRPKHNYMNVIVNDNVFSYFVFSGLHPERTGRHRNMHKGLTDVFSTKDVPSVDPVI